MGAGKKIVFAIGICVFGILYLQMRPMTFKEKECAEKQYRMSVLDSLFEGSNAEFLSSGKCDHCHGFDENGIASTDGEGGDVNLVDDWSSTMMANSAKDPLWRAKVSHEVAINPSLQSEIEGTCTRCHASLGRFAGLMNGQAEYSIEEMLLDSVALDGVSCLSCHRQAPQPDVALHTGKLLFSENFVAYGQYESPLISPMAEYTGYIPEHSAHISDSKLCAACHSLVTPTVDISGTPTGSEFIEQATWHEWLNSSYPTQNMQCQTCHLPKLEGQNIQLAAGFPTVPRPNFALHTLAGGNSLMLGLLRDNHESLGIFAGEAQFNSTIAATLDNLQNKSAVMEVTEVNRTADTLFVDVKLKNITGHKLPSGYPARRMSVHVVATDANGNEIFRSGGFDDDYRIVEEDSPLEPHYNFITSENEVQIYEMVMGDVNNQRTSILLRANSHLKDNRLVPLGFSESNMVYDTTEVVLNIPDPDFNNDPLEGSGTDIIHYHIPLNNFTAQLNLSASLYYQSVPPIWLDEMSTIDTPEIANFNNMFEAADRSPVLMRSATIQVEEYVGVDEKSALQMADVRILLSGKCELTIRGNLLMEVFSTDGKLITKKGLNSGRHLLDEAISQGAYILVFTDATNKRQVEKIVLR